MTRTPLLILTALALAGCAATGTPAAQPGTITPSSTATSSTAAPPRVSYATACYQVAQHLLPAADLVAEFVTDAQKLANGGQATTRRFDAAIADFDYDAQVAPGPLVPFIQEQRDTLVDLRSYLQVGGARNTDLRAFRSSGPEIINQCAGNH